MTLKTNKFKIQILMFLGVLIYIIIFIVMTRNWRTPVDEYQKESKDLCKAILKKYEQQVPKYELSAFDRVIGIKIIFDDTVNGEVTNHFTTDELKTVYNIYLDIITSLHKHEYQFVEENTETFYIRIKKRKQIDPYKEVNLNYYCGDELEPTKILSAAATCKWSDLGLFTEMNQVSYLGATGDVTVFKNYSDLKNLKLKGTNSFTQGSPFTQEERLVITQEINNMFPECKVEWE